MNKTPKSTSHYVCHSHHSLSFYFCKMQNKVKVKMQNQAGGRTCLSGFDEAAFNKSTGRSGFCCKDLPPPFKLWSSDKSSENVFPPARVLLCCFRETVHFAPDALHTFCICLPAKASKTPALHTQTLNSSDSCRCRAAWKTFNEEPLKSNECPSENWVRCECWLGIKCWTIDPGASAVYVPQSLISNIRWWEKTKKGLQTFTLCIWPHFTAQLLRFVYSR